MRTVSSRILAIGVGRERCQGRADRGMRYARTCGQGTGYSCLVLHQQFKSINYTGLLVDFWRWQWQNIEKRLATCLGAVCNKVEWDVAEGDGDGDDMIRDIQKRR